MAWAKNGSTTATGTTDTIDIDPITDNTFHVILHHGLYSGDSNGSFTLNSDTGSNYAQRNNYSGGSEGTSTSQTKFGYNDSSVHDSIFAISYIVNIATEEKLIITYQATIGATGAGTAPTRAEQVGKWANTSNAIDSVTHTQTSVGGDYIINSNVSILSTS